MTRIHPRRGAAVAVALALAFVQLVGCAGPPFGPPSSHGAPANERPGSSNEPTVGPSDTLDPKSRPAPTRSPSPTPAPFRERTRPRTLVPLVPVTGFWSSERSISRAGLAAALAGTGTHAREVLVTADELGRLGAVLGVAPGPNARAVSAADIRAAISKSPASLGILRAEDVTPDVRALSVDGVALFGEGRVLDLAEWPLTLAEAPGARRSTFDPASTWTLAAGGDVMLDRAVYRAAVIEGKGPDYPWDGGTARITARVCCGEPGLLVVRGRRTGEAGAVRALLRGADVTLVNLEGPAPDRFRYHPDGLTFTMDPALLVGLRDAGIDVVSLANNHVRNAGTAGVAQTIGHLDDLGIRHAGAGRNASAARRPAWLTAGGLRIALLAYNGSQPWLNATAASAGAAPLRLGAMRADIRAARRAGADVVIVAPHWGREYTDRVSTSQRRTAAGLVAAGADLVLGSHSHWAGPLELIDGRLVVYSLGDLVFDLLHDERTQEGVIAELTFVGTRLAQVELHPTLILGGAQPNLLDAAGGGNALLRAIRAGSAWLRP